MENSYTLSIDKASESEFLIGTILEIQGSKFKTDDFNELMQMANQAILTHLSEIGKESTPYRIQRLFGEGFIAGRRKDDPEIQLFSALQTSLVQHSISSFESANAFAKIALNSLILLNGGALIAVLTFYGNFLIKTSIVLNLQNLSIGVVTYALGLIAALIACAIGFWCQNSQTKEISKEFSEMSMNFYAILRMTKITDAQKKDVDKKIKKPWFPSAVLRCVAMFFAFLSIVLFCIGSIYSLLSLYDNIHP